MTVKVILEFTDYSQEIIYLDDLNVGEAMKKVYNKNKDKKIYRVVGEKI